MPSNLMSPLMFQSVPFADPDAWDDFQGVHAAWHRELAKATGTLFIPMDDLRSNLLPHGMMHDAIADALGLTRAADLLSFDLADRDSYYGFQQTNGLDHIRFRIATGL